MFTALAPDVWTLAVDHPFLGLKFGARMTVVRLPDGGLLLHSPVPLDDERRAAVNALGEVRYIVAPNLFHHLYAGDWARAYPEARLYGPAGLAKKRPDLKLAGALADLAGGAAPWGDSVVPIPFEGQTTMSETVLWHPATRTLISSDLYSAVQPTTHTWTRVYAWMTGLRPEPSVNLAMRFAVTDKAAARRSVDGLLALDPERVVIAHGSITETDGAAALRSAWSWLTP